MCCFKHILTCLCGILLFSMFFGLLGFPVKAEGNKGWKQDEFVISTFHVVPGAPNGFYTQILQNTKKAGLNYAESTFSSREANETALEISEQIGLKLIIQDTGFYGGFQNKNVPDTTEDSVIAGINHYKKYKSFGGYYVWDEPFIGQLSNVRRDIDWIKKHDPKALCLSVALQSYSPVYWWPNGTFKEYIDKYVEIIDPELLSFDYYVFDADVDNGTPFNESYMWMDMAYIRKKAMEKSIPFWFYIQLQSEIGDPNINFSPMTKGRVSVQAYISMAFGAKGIQYFNVLGGILDDYGRPNELFNDVAALNKNIENLGKTLLNLETTIAYPTIALSRKEYIDNITDSKLVAEAPSNMFLGEFKDKDGIDYLMPVNCDYENGLQNKIILKQPKDIYEVDKNTGDLTLVANNAAEIEFTYDAGEGALYAIRPIGNAIDSSDNDILIFAFIVIAAVILVSAFVLIMAIVLSKRKRG